MNIIKKTILFTICISAIVFSAVSCTKNESGNEDLPQSSVPEITQTAAPVEAELSNTNNSIEKKIYLSESIKENMNVIAKYSYDMDNDGIKEDIVLTSDIKMGMENETDGHNRQLYIKDGENFYILADQYIQLGTMEFEVMDYYKENQPIPTIVVTYDTNSMLKLYAYTFDDENNCYTERELYNSSNESKNGINKMYSSLK